MGSRACGITGTVSLWQAALLCLFGAPNLWWNYTHKMAAFKHLYEISQIEHAHLHLTSALAFLGAQIGIVGLVTVH